MESIKVENLSFSYPNKTDKAIDSISFSAYQGEFVLICGKSGCGKTTLLRLLKPSLSPYGKKDGNIYFDGIPLGNLDAREDAGRIGFVMQNPENQIVTDKVWHELAFGLESLGYKQSEIRTRVSEMASFFGLQSWFYKNISELSGGQKQLLNLASVISADPSVLILDEPTSQLDPIASLEFFNTVKKLNRELGVTVILTEHRLEDAFALADRIIVMDEGKIVADDVPGKIGRILKSMNHDMYKALPTPVRVHGEVQNTMPCPLTIREGRYWLNEYSKENPLNPDAIPKGDSKIKGEPVIEVKDAWFRYGKNLPDVEKGLNLTVGKGELFVLVGGNATGKTTALSLISGLNKAYRGDVLIKGQSISKIHNLYNGLLGVLPQNPQNVFEKNTVYLDLMEMLSAQKMTKEEKNQKVQDIAYLCHIENLFDTHPYDLSGGEMQRCALAKILLTEPEILLLDEPTKGMDAHFKTEFASILNDLKASGATILMVSHDIEFCAEFADKCALFFDGSITSEGSPREFFKGKSFYTTSANRMARNHLPDAILADDIILACGGNIKKEKHSATRTPKTIKTPKPTAQEINITKSERKINKETVFACILTLLLIPCTIYIGKTFFGDRKYYFTSLLIMLEAMIPFFMMFESRKPKARELITISVLCAIAVAGRGAFLMLPQFKPVVALVIIAGVCFGGETGFLVGSITGFVSNFFFGQGPWTPWQMFALGVIGFVSGMVFNYTSIKKTRVILCIFGFIMTFVFYGGIMNPASIIMWQSKITKEMIISSYTVAVPFDLIHSLSTAFFLWFISMPMLSKLERIKIKYGLMRIINL